MPHDDSPDLARRRALHAARAVTLGLGLALAGTGCSQSHDPGPPAPDTGPPPSDAMVDASDGGADADVCATADWWSHEECCEASGGFWDGFGCAVPGPFVPPDVPA